MNGDIFSMLGEMMNPNRKVIGNWESEDGSMVVDTCSVCDGDKEFETAFMHPDYRNGHMIIVEAYDTESEAKIGHEKWLKVMLEGPLPPVLSDCCNSHIQQVTHEQGMEIDFERDTSHDKEE